MKASKKNRFPNEIYVLELSPTEMHIIMQAMNAYGHKTGYGQWNASKPNESHAAAAELFHDQLTDFYCAEEEPEIHDDPSYRDEEQELGTPIEQDY